MSIKEKYKVKSIAKYLCKDWLLHKHYAKRIPSISNIHNIKNELSDKIFRLETYHATSH